MAGEDIGLRVERTRTGGLLKVELPPKLMSDNSIYSQAAYHRTNDPDGTIHIFTMPSSPDDIVRLLLMGENPIHKTVCYKRGIQWFGVYVLTQVEDSLSPTVQTRPYPPGDIEYQALELLLAASKLEY